MDFSFEAKDSNTYDDYFITYFDERNNNDTSEIYKSHLNTASKSKVIDLAIQANSKYENANNLAYSRETEISNLNKKIEDLNSRLSTNISVSNKKVNNYKVISSISICLSVLLISVFYIYQAIKKALNNYAKKVRAETIEELNSKEENNG